MINFILGSIFSFTIIYIFRGFLILQYQEEIRENKLARREIEKVTASNRVEFNKLMSEVRSTYGIKVKNN